MHGPDFDLRLLRRDLDIGVRGLVDTQVCAALLGEENLGLAHLLESRLGVRLSKKYQRADWAERPLSPEMLEYAADDTRHLDDLAERDLRAHRLDAGDVVIWSGRDTTFRTHIVEQEEARDQLVAFGAARVLRITRDGARAGLTPELLALVVDLDRPERDRLPPDRTIEVLGKNFPVLNNPGSLHFPHAILQYLRAGRSD